MSLESLDAPVRLTWDLPIGEAGMAEQCLPDVAGRIAEAGVFFVSLQGRPLLCPGLDEILGQLKGCQLLITCSGDGAELDVLAGLAPSASQILLDAAAFAAAGLARDALADVVKRLRGLGCEPAIALTPLRKNLNVIADLVRFCGELGIARFKLPNAHIGDSFDGYSAAELPRWQDLEAFRADWQEFSANEKSLPAMEIHDLFLWEIMTPGQLQNRSEYGGCQAGNSLAHVDVHGVVHPCSAWPQPLGSLPGQSLEDIWAGAERMAVRARIARMPAGCDGCKDLNICFGGCRGLAFHLNRSAGERDLMCSGPR